MRNKLLVEAVGTFFLCLAVLVSGGPLPVAALLCAQLYMGAPISLPHYNPAVTLAFRLRGRISTRTLGAGALVGHDTERAKAAVDALGSPAFEGFLASATVELLGTFLFAFVVLTVGTSRLTAGNSYFGLAIALAALGVAGIFSDFGSSINPATALAASLFGACAALSEGLEGTKAFVTETVYLAKIAPRVLSEVGVQFLGAALAAWFFRYLFPEDR